MSLNGEVWIASGSEEAALRLAGRLALAGCAVRVGSSDACETIGRGVPSAVVFAQADGSTVSQVQGFRSRHPESGVVVVADGTDVRQVVELMRIHRVDVVLEDDGLNAVWEAVQRLAALPAEPRASGGSDFSVSPAIAAPVLSAPVLSAPVLSAPLASPAGPSAASILSIARGERTVPAFHAPAAAALWAPSATPSGARAPIPAPPTRPAASSVASRTVAATPDLPVLDSRFEKLDALMRREDCSTIDVERFASQDLVLVQAIITASNMAYYRSPKMVTNLRDAIVRVGNKQVFALMMETLMRKAFDVPSAEAKSVLSAMWQNATLTAQLTRRLAEWEGFARPEDAYVAALLHNLGECVMVWRLLQHPGGMGRLAAEVPGIAANHEAVGFAAGQKWGCPPLAQVMMRSHHSAGRTESPREADLRNAIMGCWALARQLLGDYLPDQPGVESADHFADLRLSESVLTRLANECAEALKGV
ncbi:hypothetical protein LBMAG42_45080 [Deltaproteobacteria bacterium]|nr:hypothetical protein LBMAG42_45080 [Deltaproteobacteria bacterium]